MSTYFGKRHNWREIDASIQPPASHSTSLNHSQSKQMKTPPSLTSPSSHQGLSQLGDTSWMSPLCVMLPVPSCPPTQGENMVPVKPSCETCILNLWVRTGWSEAPSKAGLPSVLLLQRQRFQALDATLNELRFLAKNFTFPDLSYF